MSERLAVGLDIGSTTTKAALIAVDVATGGVREVATSATPTPTDADELASRALAVARDVVGDRGPRVVAIGVASMAETGVPIDSDGVPLTPLLRWDAGHGAGGAAELAPVSAQLFERTGVRLSAKTPLATWAGLRLDQPDVVARWAVWLGAADVVVHRLTGERVTDHTLAGRTGGYPLGRLDAPAASEFDGELVGLVGLRPEQLPRVAGPTEIAARTTPAVARELGVPAGTPVVVAGHDHQVAAWAAGVRQPGRVADSLGTAEAVLSVLPAVPPMAPVRAEGMSVVRTVAADHVALVAGSGTAGAMLRHWLESVPVALRESALEQAAVELAAHPQPTGAAVPPYLRGRQSPEPDPSARAGSPPPSWPWQRQALAVVEGICYQARWMITRQTELAAAEVSAVVVIGGDRLPRLWTDLKRVTSPWPVEAVLTAEPVAAGAGLLALVRAGELGDPAGVLHAAPTLPRRTSSPPGGDPHADAVAQFVADAVRRAERVVVPRSASVDADGLP